MPAFLVSRSPPSREFRGGPPGEPAPRPSTLDNVARGRTAVSTAHRLSTAEASDEVLVFEHGRIVRRGPHAEPVWRDGVYADRYASRTSAARIS